MGQNRQLGTFPGTLVNAITRPKSVQTRERGTGRLRAVLGRVEYSYS